MRQLFETNVSLEMSKPSMMKRLILIWILLAIFLTGCSSTSLVYNNANWLVRGKIDDYFSLTDRQQQQLKRDLDNVLQWHRHEELAKYSQVLTQFNQTFSDGLTSVELDFFMEQLFAARLRLANASINSANDFLSTITATQIDYFDQAFRDKHTKAAKKVDLSSAENRDENYAELVEKLEEWLGDFDEQQLKQIRTISDARPDHRQFWFNQKVSRHQRLLDLLIDKPEPEEIEQYLHDRYIVLDRGDEQTQSIRLQSKNYWRQAMLKIDKIITLQQRKYMMNRIADYASDFNALSKQSNKPLKSNKNR